MSTHRFKGAIQVDRVERRREFDKDGVCIKQWTEKAGVDQVMVEVEIDVSELIRELGTKAWLSKGKRSKALSGDIVVYARKM